MASGIHLKTSCYHSIPLIRIGWSQCRIDISLKSVLSIVMLTGDLRLPGPKPSANRYPWLYDHGLKTPAQPSMYIRFFECMVGFLAMELASNDFNPALANPFSQYDPNNCAHPLYIRNPPEWQRSGNRQTTLQGYQQGRCGLLISKGAQRLSWRA